MSKLILIIAIFLPLQAMANDYSKLIELKEKIDKDITTSHKVCGIPQKRTIEDWYCDFLREEIVNNIKQVQEIKGAKNEK